MTSPHLLRHDVAYKFRENVVFFLGCIDLDELRLISLTNFLYIFKKWVKREKNDIFMRPTNKITRGEGSAKTPPREYILKPVNIFDLTLL